jgi:hypothetical protein
MALTSDQVEKLRGLLQSSGWREVVRPAVEQRAKAASSLFRLLPSERPESYRGLDDSTVLNLLRGRLEELEWLMTAFNNEVTVHDINLRADELRREPQANPVE